MPITPTQFGEIIRAGLNAVKSNLPRLAREGGIGKITQFALGREGYMILMDDNRDWIEIARPDGLLGAFNHLLTLTYKPESYTQQMAQFGCGVCEVMDPCECECFNDEDE